MNLPAMNNQPVSDDNDLAKILSGADGQVPDAPVPEPIQEEVPEQVIPEALTAPVPNGHEELEGIKKEALEELKPLVDKLQLPPEEKFDILLLIIRSTDDEELVAKAHATAVLIEDETRKAQALLDVIKEVDYFANK